MKEEGEINHHLRLLHHIKSKNQPTSHVCEEGLVIKSQVQSG